MAFIKPDYKLKEAKKLIDNLDDSEENKLIKYYIGKQEKWIEDQNERLKEYREFFNMMDKFLPSRHPTVYK
jgi:hypothetical protein